MPVAEEWYLDKIVLPSSVEFHAMDSATLDANITSMIERGAGEVHPNFIATQSQRPRVQFATTQIGTILANIPLVGAAIASGTMYLKKGTTTGRISRATTSHKKVAWTTACVYWSTIRLPHNGRGTVDVIVETIYDGTNKPFIYTGSVALSGSVSTQDYFGAGPVVINGTSYTDVQEITISSGVQLDILGGSSEVYNTAIAVQSVEPSIEVSLLRSINWPTLTPDGLALDGTNGFIAYGRKFASDGDRVANGTAGHVGASCLSGRVVPLTTSGNGAGTLVDRFRVEPRYNATPATSLAVSGATKIDSDPTFSNL